MSGADRYFRDSRHGQLLPEGTPLTHLMAAVLPHVMNEAIRQGQHGRLSVDISSWIPAIQQASTPILSAYWRRGYSDRASQMRTKLRRPRSKALPPVRDVRHGFATTQIEVGRYIRDQAFAFADSTMATATKEAEAALQAVRDELGAAHESREGRDEIAARMRKIFTDPHKAARIGATESCRAVNAGALTAAIESGICTGTTWRGNSGMCGACLALDGKTVKLGEPFMILDHAKPLYRIVLHPPLHPWCHCTTDSVIDVSGIDIPTVDEHLASMVEVGKRPTPAPRPRASKPTRQWLGGWTNGWYHERGYRVPHPDDPLGGRWPRPIP